MGLFTKKKEDKKKVDAKPAAPEKSKAPKADAKKAPAKKAVAKKSAPTKSNTGDAYRVLLRPIVTEKSTRLSKDSKYVFEVAVDCNKIQIKQAVKDVYGVDPVDVTVLRVLGKPVRSRYGRGRRKNWRKAVVTLKKGQTIEVFSSKQ